MKGKELGNYKILKKIDEHGKFGELFHAISKKSKKYYVVELIEKAIKDKEDQYIKQDCNLRCNIRSGSSTLF